jgi:surface protein
MTAVTGAWADQQYLYLEVSGTSATMKYGEDYSGKPYYDDHAEWWTSYSEPWNGKGTIKTITVDVSCQNVNYSNLSGLFFDFSGLEAINNAGNLNTSQVQDMSRMFVNCSSFTKLDLSDWDTSKVTDMLSMFDGCLALTALNISGWNTGELTNTQGMFENCVNLKFIYVGAGWSTTKVTDGVGMFYLCENLPNWDNTTDVSKAYVGDGGYLTSNMKTIYCKMEYGWWTQDGAAIGIYAWGDNNQKNADYPGKRMTLADGETNIWKFDLDIAKYENCIFTRVNGSGDIADWGAKTQDLTIPTNDDDMFTITSSTAVWGDPGCEGTWSKYIAPKFILAGSMTNWEENMIKVYDDSYVLDLNAGKYQIKVIDNGSWKGIDDLTEVAGGLYRDQDGNICFKLDHVCNVTVNYKSGELFTVEGEFADPEIKLIGIKGWNDPENSIVLTPAADHKSASAKMTLEEDKRYEFKVIRADEWLGKENGDENYLIKKDWNWVAGLVKDDSDLNRISLQTDGVNKEYTFTYEYATDKLTVIYPGLNTITIDDGNIDAANWSAEPTEQYDGQNVTLKYKGKKKIKRITIVPAPTGPTAYTLAESTVGMIVGSDGKAYAVADKDNLPSGVTAVAMVAYKSGSNGLAIQLNGSPVSKNWADAKTYAEGLTAVPGGTWRLPSMADWQNMFVGCAVSGDASANDYYMNPIAGFKAKIAASGITWQSSSYWSSTESGSNASVVGVYLSGSYAYAGFDEKVPSLEFNVLGCLAF